MRIHTVTHKKTNIFIDWLKQQEYPITLNNSDLANKIQSPYFFVTFNSNGWRRCRGLEAVIARLKKQKALVQTGRGNSRKLYPTIDLDKYNSKTFDANSLLGLRGYNPDRKDIHRTVVKYVDVHLQNSNVNRETRYRNAYRTIYAQFAITTGVDLYEEIAKIKSRTGRKLLKIDVVESLNLIPQLFLVALSCLFDYKSF